jgi:small-conductance mechanosensitive channel
MDWVTRPFLAIAGAQVSLATLGLFVAVLVLVVVTARVVGSLVTTRLLSRTAMDRGLQFAVGRMVYYAFLVIGLLVALQTSGIEVGSLTVVLGALGVGIGFGLQNLVNNFVGGLILLAERPIKVGDRIDVAGTGGRVERIGARSTTIVTNDNITMIVPNAEFVTQRVTNWSHGDPRVRFRIPVGVAYGSDLEVVQRALVEVGAAHPAVLEEPPPTVFFDGFGDSSLNLELAVWSRDMAHNPRRLRSDLNFAIDAAFRRHGIVIPFPQRDLHLRSAEALRGAMPSGPP